MLASLRLHHIEVHARTDYEYFSPNCLDRAELRLVVKKRLKAMVHLPLQHSERVLVIIHLEVVSKSFQFIYFS